MKLSILICSVNNRISTFLPKVLNKLTHQANLFQDVEVITLMDNKKIMLGEKRNMLIKIAAGDYITFVDDDDDVSDDYVKTLLEGIKTNCDVITFTVNVSLNGGEYKSCFYSKNFLKDYNTVDAYYRLPNHLMCIKKELCLDIPYKPILRGEDSAFSKDLFPKITSEHIINDVLYYYNFNQTTTETQKILKRKNSLIDIVILSDAKTEELKNVTQRCINTLKGSESDIFNIIVIESNPNVNWNEGTIHPDIPFNYNSYCNIGANAGTSEWICFCNNDLIFTKGWATELLKAGKESMSPKCPNNRLQNDMNEIHEGYQTAKHISGWCIFMKRNLWNQIGGLDEDFEFWCADDSYREQLIKHNVPHYLVGTSNVVHLGSVTLKTVDSETKEKYTKHQAKKYNAKFGKNLFNLNGKS